MICIWIETVLWGINCVLFSGVCFVLLKRTGRKGINSGWILGITSVVLFAMVTVHVGISLRQLLEAFVNIPSGSSPLYSTLYWIDETNRLAVVKDYIYNYTVFIQDLILIWRMYIVWGKNWKICVIPVLVELVHTGVATAGTVLLAKPGANPESPVLSKLGVAGWSLDLAVNISVTAAIAGRLWFMGMKVSSISSSRQGYNPYLTSILTIVESGALFAVVTMVLLVLYEVGSPLALTVIDVATQLATTTPLLIIVRVGLGLTHKLPDAYSTYKSTTSHGTAFRTASHTAVHIGMEQDTVTSGSYREDYPLQEMKAVKGSLA